MTLLNRWCAFGLGALSVFFGSRLMAKAAITVPSTSEPEPVIDCALMERAAELEWHAGDRHPFIGNDPFSCALCLSVETHPIHRLEPA